jgi:hypothetical protein
LTTGWNTSACAQYEIAYASGDKVATKANSAIVGGGAAIDKSQRFVGVVDTVHASTGKLCVAGEYLMYYDANGIPSVGEPVYLSELTSGYMTKTAPSTTGDVVNEVGIVVNDSDVSGKVLVQIQPKVAILL